MIESEAIVIARKQAITQGLKIGVPIETKFHREGRTLMDSHMLPDKSLLRMSCWELLFAIDNDEVNRFNRLLQAGTGNTYDVSYHRRDKVTTIVFENGRCFLQPVQDTWASN